MSTKITQPSPVPPELPGIFASTTISHSQRPLRAGVRHHPPQKPLLSRSPVTSAILTQRQSLTSPALSSDASSLLTLFPGEFQNTVVPGSPTFFFLPLWFPPLPALARFLDLCLYSLLISSTFFFLMPQYTSPSSIPYYAGLPHPTPGF